MAAENTARAETQRAQQAANMMKMQQEQIRKETLQRQQVEDTNKATEILRQQIATDIAVANLAAAENEAKLQQDKTDLQQRLRREQQHQQATDAKMCHEALLASLEA